MTTAWRSLNCLGAEIPVKRDGPKLYILAMKTNIGPIQIWHKAIRRLRRKPSSKILNVLVKDLDSSLAICEARLPVIFKALPQDTEVVEAKLASLPIEHRPDIKQRIETGHLCYIAEYEGQLVYVSWIALRKHYSYFLDRYYELADDEALRYSAYTFPNFRGKGIHPAATIESLIMLKQQGYKKVFSFIEPKNLAAMRMPQKLGYKKVGVTGYIELFALRWYFHLDQGGLRGLKKHYYWRKG